MSLATRSRAIILGTSLLALGACASKTEFQSFATLGEAYSNSLPPVFSEACKTHIDQSSWQLVSLSRPDGVSEEFIERRNDTDLATCSRLDRLAEHSAALGAYFSALGKLAQENDDKGFGRAAKSTFERARKLGQLVRSDFNIPVSGDLVAGIVNVAVNAKIEGALRRELLARKDLLAEEFATLDQALEIVASDLEAQKQQINVILSDVAVFDPLVQGRVTNPKTIADARLSLLRPSQSVEAVVAAREASIAVREAFATLISTEPGAKVIYERLEALAGQLSQLQSLIALLQRP